MTILAFILVTILAYVLGRMRGFYLGIRYIASLSPEEPNPFLEAQRENAPFQ